MRKRISWTTRLPDGAKREVRVNVDVHHAKWQFKRSDEKQWDYESTPTSEDWDALEEILSRRSRRGRQLRVLERVRAMRQKKGV